jgi:hypothetical protein
MRQCQLMLENDEKNNKNSSLFNEFVCKLGFFGMSGPV